MPFLRNVVKGRDVPEERLQEVAKHYMRHGGSSPINERNRLFKKTLGAELRKYGIELPVYLGNRNWHPMLADTLASMYTDGCRNALVYVTSAYGSYSGCRQYSEDMVKAQQELVDRQPGSNLELRKLRIFYDHPDFVSATVSRVHDALQLATPRIPTRLVFTAHSIPCAMAESSPYVAQLEETAGLVSNAILSNSSIILRDWDLVFQSRSGPPQVPWLEPDVTDHIRILADQGVKQIVLCPLGFLTDHMEVIHDLDTEAREVAESFGLKLVRAKTVGAHPHMVRMVRKLLQEQLQGAPAERASDLHTRLPHCTPTCCSPPRRPRLPTGTSDPSRPVSALN